MKLLASEPLVWIRKFLFIFSLLSTSIVFGQEKSFETASGLFDAFLRSENPQTNLILDHGFDFSFLEGRQSITLISKSEIETSGKFILFKVFDIENGVGRIVYTITDSKNVNNESKWITLLFDVQNRFNLLKKTNK